MEWVLLVVGLVIMLFAFTILTGAPFLPTLNRRIPEVFELLELQKGQTLLELGSGDGRLLRAAAKRGIYSIGYEINPLLVIYSRLRAWPERRFIRIYWRNFWHTDLPSVDGVYVFLTAPYMKRLDTKIVQECGKPVKVVSFAFAFPGRRPIQEKNGLALYKLSKNSTDPGR